MIVAEKNLTQGWQASLKLGYQNINARSTLVKREHYGPLAVQKAFYPEGDGVCHTVVLHPPAGIAGGDELEINIDVAQNSKALLTTPGAAKWYKSGGRVAKQKLHFSVAQDAVLEWLPQESIIFDHAAAKMNTSIELTGNAVFLGWEIICLGRVAAQEKFSEGELRQITEIKKDGKRIWGEYATLYGSDPLLDSKIGLAGYPVTGIFLLAGKKPSAELIAQCREIKISENEMSGVTTLPNLLVIRFLGHSTQSARQYFEKLWQVLRPGFVGVEVCVPRIWKT
jgi:urease accessory protein